MINPPSYASFVDSQRSNFLRYSLWIATIAFFVIAFIKLVTGAYFVVVLGVLGF